MRSSALLAVAAAAVLAGCGRDPDLRDLPVCSRQFHVGPERNTPPPTEVICGLSVAGPEWRISGPGPVYDSRRTLLAMDSQLPGKTIKAECELRAQSARIDDKWVWAQLVSAPGIYCKVRP